MSYRVDIIGAGLAGSETALQLARRGIDVRLFEMRPAKRTAVHHGGSCAELVCSNSLKSTKPTSAAGMLKEELARLGSALYAIALECRVPAGGALAVDRDRFSARVDAAVAESPHIRRIDAEVAGVADDGRPLVVDDAGETHPFDGEAPDAVVLAAGPLCSDALAGWLAGRTGTENLYFFDAAAPIVAADDLDLGRIFRADRYGDDTDGDYLNAPMDRATYEAFIGELTAAQRVVLHDFETTELFQACQPIEEIARRGVDAPRFGALKPVGLIDPNTGHRPWAAVQLRAENEAGTCYNLVGFQTNLTFPEQSRVFRMIPGLEQAEFLRFGVMHRNTFVDAPHLLDVDLRLHLDESPDVPLYVAGQLSGTEGYCEAIRSGLHAALSVTAALSGVKAPAVPRATVFGSLLGYACDPATVDYQPMHVNFGILEPIEPHIRNKADRYAAYAQRGGTALDDYVAALSRLALLPDKEN